MSMMVVSPYTSGSFYIDNVSGGTNNNDGTVTPTTPSSVRQYYDDI